MLNYEWMKEHARSIGLILLVVMVVLMLQLYLRFEDGKIYRETDGILVALERETLEESLSVPLTVEVEQDGKKRSFDITLNLLDQNDENDIEQEAMTEETDRLENEIEALVSDLERKDTLYISLPQSLADGTHLIWKQPSMMSDLLIIFLFPLGVAYLYHSDQESVNRERRQEREDIRRALPAFNDQVLLLMNSGLIFHDAFLRIAEGYRSRAQIDAFGQLLLQIVQQMNTSGRSIVSVMEDAKQDVAMREYSRMVNIIADHQIKGVGLKEKLESESHLLWESRKALALQKGKEMETKMTFPLAVLLIVIVIITGVPAIMSV